MTNVIFKLSEHDQKKLEAFEIMVNAVKDDFISRPIYRNKLTPKQTLLVTMFAAVNSYTEAIFELCKQGRGEAANVIMRSVTEAFINSNYIFSYPNDKKLHLFAIEDSYYKRSFVCVMNDYFSRYPKQRSASWSRKIMKEMEDIPKKELIEYAEKVGISFENKDEFDQAFGSLLSRAKEVDERLHKKQKDKAGGIEKVYILAYKYLSEYAHLSMRGLQNFWQKTKDGDTLVIDKNPDNLTLVLDTSYILYLYFAERLKQYGLIEISLHSFEQESKETKPDV